MDEDILVGGDAYLFPPFERVKVTRGVENVIRFNPLPVNTFVILAHAMYLLLESVG